MRETGCLLGRGGGPGSGQPATVSQAWILNEATPVRILPNNPEWNE